MLTKHITLHTLSLLRRQQVFPLQQADLLKGKCNTNIKDVGTGCKGARSMRTGSKCTEDMWTGC